MINILQPIKLFITQPFEFVSEVVNRETVGKLIDNSVLLK